MIGADEKAEFVNSVGARLLEQDLIGFTESFGSDLGDEFGEKMEVKMVKRTKNYP